MQNFDYQRRTYLLFGRGRENEVGSLVKYEGGRRVLLLCDRDIQRQVGLLDRIRRSLDRAGLECFEFWSPSSEAKTDIVYQGIEYCKTQQIDFILALGGSDLIYIAKAVGAGAVYSGDFWDFFNGKREPVMTLPTGAIVTKPDVGAECSTTCMLCGDIDGYKCRVHKSSYAFLPSFAVLNPELCLSVTPEESACACMDFITHVLSYYFTNTPGVSFTDELCESMLRTVINLLPRIQENPEDYDTRSNLILAGTMAQNGMCSVGREQDWACYTLEMELFKRYGTNHSYGLAVIVPAWLTFCMHHDVMRMAQFAVRVFGVPMDYVDPQHTARMGIDKLRLFLTSSGLPQNFIEMGLPMVDVQKLVESLHLGKDRTLGSYVKLDDRACEVILTIAYSYRHNFSKKQMTDKDSQAFSPSSRVFL